MSRKLFADSVALLQNAFPRLDWTLHDAPDGRGKMYRWPGEPAEEILVCVHKSAGLREAFHTHDFFFFNYTYRGSYESLSERPDRRITIGEGEIFAGQIADRQQHPFVLHFDVFDLRGIQRRDAGDRDRVAVLLFGIAECHTAAVDRCVLDSDVCAEQGLQAFFHLCLRQQHLTVRKIIAVGVWVLQQNVPDRD